MIDLAWPLALLLLPMPWLLRRLLPAAEVPITAGLRLPFYAEAVKLAASAATRRSRRGLGLLGLLWLLLCLAAARPQRLDEMAELPLTGRDLLLAIDVSGSMAAQDMSIGGTPVDRLTAVKVVAGEFIARRVGDRIGLILFGQQAYLLTPLTYDRDSARYQLETSAVGIAGRETAIGDAIGLAVKRLRDRPQGQRVLVLLTDGVNTAGALPPDKASELARDAGVRIYTIGIGGDAPSTSMFGMLLPTPAAEIDEALLQRVAEASGGRYFRARDTQELAGIYAELDRLEPAAEGGERLRPQQELFVYPLASALFAGLLAALWERRRRRIAA